MIENSLKYYWSTSYNITKLFLVFFIQVLSYLGLFE